MFKQLFKNIFFFLLIAVISLLVICGVRDLYDEWRLALCDLDGDGIFGGLEGTSKQHSVFMARNLGIPYILGVLIIIPHIIIVSFIASLILLFFERKKIKFFSKMECLFSKPIVKSSLVIQVLISVILELIAGIIIFTIFFNKVTKDNPSTLLRPETPYQIIMYSALCYFFSLVTGIFANNTFKYSSLIRICWVILIFKFFLSIIVKDYMDFDKDSFLFTFIPFSILIPLCTISLRRTKQNQKSISSIHFFKYFVGIYILITCLYSFPPFKYPFERMYLIKYKLVRNVIISLYLIITGLLKFSIAEKVYGIIKKRNCLEKNCRVNDNGSKES